MSNKELVDVIFYTTIYRSGGEKFQLAAQTLQKKLFQQNEVPIVCVATESKKDFRKIIEKLSLENKFIRNFHFFGHSGMYGIMFGSVAWPEQFSPYEWRQMKIPVTVESKFYFHACRSGRWFAAFFARTFAVTAFGYHNYTTVSLQPDRFVWSGWRKSKLDPVYIIACPGKKSHGVLASLQKYLGLVKADAFLQFTPNQKELDASYDEVAELYDKTFASIKVRKSELTWLRKKLQWIQPKDVLDIGCGNGSFLRELSSQFERGVGVDASAQMIEQARLHPSQLKFEKIDGPVLPFPDNSFDVVTSVLSFRYLDWDPLLIEILRVLKPGGHFLVVDMVAEPLRIKDLFYFAISRLQMWLVHLQNAEFRKNLKKMVNHPAWKIMLSQNPIRAFHEYKWFFESRFRGQKLEILQVAFTSKTVAFDSGPIHTKKVEPLSFP